MYAEVCSQPSRYQYKKEIRNLFISSFQILLNGNKHTDTNHPEFCLGFINSVWKGSLFAVIVITVMALAIM